MRVLFLIVLALSGCARASAEAPAPPDRMSPLDLAQLDAALAHVQAIEAEAKPFKETAARLFAKYQIDASQLGKSVGIDPATGEIRRAKK